MISLLVYFSVQNGTVVKQTSSLHGILPMAMQLRTTQAVRDKQQGLCSSC